MTQKVWKSRPNFAQIPFQETDSTAILLRALKSRLFLFLSVIFLFSAFHSSAHSQENADQILKELDAHYYFPQNQGLKKLSVRLEWEQLDVITDSGMYLKNPPIEFRWEKNQGISKSAFQLAEKSADVSDERKKELLSMLENYKEIVIPKTLAEKMAGYEGRIKISRKEKSLLEFASKNPGSDIKKYGLMVDLEQKKVWKFKIERKSAPFNIMSDIRYTRQDGKWMVAESRSLFQFGEMEYLETTEYVYRRTGKFWLIAKMSQTLKTDDRILQSYIFRFHDYKIN